MIDKKRLKGVFTFMPDAWDNELKFDRERYYYNACTLFNQGSDAIISPIIVGESKEYKDEELFQAWIALATAANKIGKLAGAAFIADDVTYAAHKAELAQKTKVHIICVMIPASDRKNILNAICEAAPDCAIINLSSSPKMKVSGREYASLMDTLPPNFSGMVMSSTDLYTFAEIIRHTPGLAHFACEWLFVPGMQLGADGIAGTLTSMNPEIFLKTFNLCKEKKWDEAMKIQRELFAMFDETYNDISSYSDVTLDTAYAMANGGLNLLMRHRLEQPVLSEDQIKTIMSIIKTKYPMFSREI